MAGPARRRGADGHHAVRLYLLLARAEYRSARQHRASFVLLGPTSTIMVALDFVVIAFLLQRIPRLGGFSLAQMGVLYGLASLAERLADLAVGDVEKVSFRSGCASDRPTPPPPSWWLPSPPPTACATSRWRSRTSRTWCARLYGTAPRN